MRWPSNCTTPLRCASRQPRLYSVEHVLSDRSLFRFLAEPLEPIYRAFKLFRTSVPQRAQGTRVRGA